MPPKSAAGSVSTSNSSLQTAARQQEIVEKTEVPQYFDSEEGRNFLRKTLKKSILSQNGKEPGSFAAEEKKVVEETPPDVFEEQKLENSLPNISDKSQMPINEVTDIRLSDATEVPLNLTGRPIIDYDILGQPRREKVRLPRIFNSSGANVEPNQKGIDIEAPVKRRLKTVSLSLKRSQLIDIATSPILFQVHIRL